VTLWVSEVVMMFIIPVFKVLWVSNMMDKSLIAIIGGRRKCDFGSILACFDRGSLDFGCSEGFEDRALVVKLWAKPKTGVFVVKTKELTFFCGAMLALPI